MTNIIFGNGFIGNILLNELDGFKMSCVNPLFCNELTDVLEEEKPEIVINCIGKTGRPNIDWCEDHVEETILSNTVVPSILAVECSKRGIYFVHLSSGCIYSDRDDDILLIFQDKKIVFLEDDEPNFYKYQTYARSKILAEKVVDNFDALQVRIRMPICSYPDDRNLITKLSRYKKVADIDNSMTVVDDFVAAIKVLIENRALGKYNIVNKGVTSAYKIMKMYSEIVDPSHSVICLNKNELNEITRVERANCHISSGKLEKYGIVMPDIEDSVRRSLIRYKNNASK